MVQGQVAIITGAAKGIGRTIAHTFARAGAKLGIVDIDTKRLHKVSEELRQMGAEVLPEFGDVSNEYEVRRMVDGVVTRFGCIDVLVNDAAVEREWEICVVAVTPGGAIATEDAPEAVHQQMAGLDSLGNRFLLAAEAGMEMTGQLLTLKEGRLEIRH